MRIDTEKIRKLLEELKTRDELEKGAQPELSLGCFMKLGCDNTEKYCAGCRSYEWTCSLHLKSFEIKDNPFELHQQEVYNQMIRGEKV